MVYNDAAQITAVITRVGISADFIHTFFHLTVLKEQKMCPLMFFMKRQT
jgi:hypothetical protein